MARITFLVHKGKEYTVRKYLASWGQDLADRVDVRHYPRLRSTGHTWLKRLSQEVRARRLGTLRDPGPPTGERRIYIFTDVERLSPAETVVAEGLYKRLEEHPDTALIINHPTRSRRRLELLQLLKARGVNSFGVYPAADHPTPESWPVFVRDENEHGGSFSELLHSPSELEQELARVGGAGLESKVVVEHCDTADAEGTIRKYGAFRVRGRIIARQIHFSHQWIVRVPDLMEPWTAREELEYVETNPHQEELMEIFALARIDYGRVDYSVANGKIQVWEINTNPMILIPKDRQDPLRFAAHDHFGKTFSASLEALMARVSG